jgi:hypothetical protein
VTDVCQGMTVHIFKGGSGAGEAPLLEFAVPQEIAAGLSFARSGSVFGWQVEVLWKCSACALSKIHTANRHETTPEDRPS